MNKNKISLLILLTVITNLICASKDENNNKTNPVVAEKKTAPVDLAHPRIKTNNEEIAKLKEKLTKIEAKEKEATSEDAKNELKQDTKNTNLKIDILRQENAYLNAQDKYDNANPGMIQDTYRWINMQLGETATKSLVLVGAGVLLFGAHQAYKLLCSNVEEDEEDTDLDNN